MCTSLLFLPVKSCFEHHVLIISDFICKTTKTFNISKKIIGYYAGSHPSTFHHFGVLAAFWQCGNRRVATWIGYMNEILSHYVLSPSSSRHCWKYSHVTQHCLQCFFLLLNIQCFNLLITIFPPAIFQTENITIRVSFKVTPKGTLTYFE